MSHEAFGELRRRTLRQLAMMGVFLSIFLVVFFLVKTEMRGAAAPVALVIVGFAMFMGTRNAMKRSQRQLESFRILLDDHSIRRVMNEFPDLAVQRSEVTAIEEREGQGLAVYGTDRRVSLPVPIHVERYAELRRALEQWHPIEPKPPARGAGWTVLAMAAVIAGFGVTFLATNLLLVIVVGSALAIALILCMVMVLRSPHTNARLKRNMLVALLPLAAIIARVAMALGGR